MKSNESLMELKVVSCSGLSSGANHDCGNKKKWFNSHVMRDVVNIVFDLTKVWNVCEVPFAIMYDHTCSIAVEKITTDLRSANPRWQVTSPALLLHFQCWSYNDRSRARSSQYEAKESCSWTQPFLCCRWYHKNLDALRFDWRNLPPTTSMLKMDPWQE